MGDTHSNDQNVNLNGDMPGVEANNQLNHESMMISDSSLGSTNLETSQLVSNETEHQPEVGNTSTNVFLNEQEMMESEEFVPSAQIDVAPFLVIIDGRSTCKFCGMQVQDKNAEEHFM